MDTNSAVKIAVFAFGLIFLAEGLEAAWTFWKLINENDRKGRIRHAVSFVCRGFLALACVAIASMLCVVVLT